jgi:transcriptional regulator with XRE-family HTH domain
MPRSERQPSSRPATADPPGAGWAPVVEAIGPKVHALRQERGMTLQQLAHAADVSAAAVHKVERGDMVPTITTLLKLAAALDTPIRHFVEAGDAPTSLAVHARGVQPADAPSGATPISGPLDRFRASAAVHRLEPDAQRKGRRRAGEVLLLVLDGALTVDVADEQYRLTAGESLHLPTHVAHSWTNPGPDRSQFLVVSVEEE